jgi:hypothetical protein
MPRSELRAVSRPHSSAEKTLLGSMRATAGMDGTSRRILTPLQPPFNRRHG